MARTTACPQAVGGGQALRAAKRRKLQVAKQYAHLTPGQALKHMERDRIPLEDRPGERQIEQQRRSTAATPTYPTETIGALRGFLAAPPPGITILHEYVVVEPNELRAPFVPSVAWATPSALDELE